MQLEIIGEFEPHGKRYTRNSTETRPNYLLSLVPSTDALQQEELFLQDNFVVWSRGEELIMSWDCTEFKQPVQQVLWCWFDAEADNGKRMLPRNRTICILLKDVALFHQIDGPSYTVHLPFVVEKAFALQVGLLLMRQSKNVADDTATIFTLMHPLEQARLLSITSMLIQTNEWFVPNDAKIEPFIDDEQVLLVDGDLMVTQSMQTRCVKFWRYCQHSQSVESEALDPAFESAYESVWEHKRESIRPSDVKQRARKKSPAPHSRRPSMRPDGLMEDLPIKEMQPDSQVMPVIFCHQLWASDNAISNPLIFCANNVDGKVVICILEAERTLTLWQVSNGVEWVDTMDAQSAIPVVATRRDCKDILMLLPDYTLSLWTGNDCIPVTLPPNFQILARTEQLSLKSFKRRRSESPRTKLPSSLMRSPSKASRVCKVMDSVGAQVNLLLSDGVVFRASLVFVPKSYLVNLCLDTLKACLKPDLYASLRTRFLTHHFKAQGLGEWGDFCVALLSFCHDKPPPVIGTSPVLTLDAWSQVLNHSASHDALLQKPDVVGDYSDYIQASRQLYLRHHTEPNAANQIPEVIYALHLVHEDLQWSVLTESSARQVAQLISVIVGNVATCRGLEIYRGKGDVHIPQASVERLQDMFEKQHPLLHDPPIVSSWVYSLYTSEIKPWPILKDLIHGHVPLATLRFTQCFLQLAKRGPRACVERMIELKVDSKDVDCMPIPLALGLRQAMRQCRSDPPETWSSAAFAMVGRDDLAQQAHEPAHHYLDCVMSMATRAQTSHEIKNIHAIADEVTVEKPEVHPEKDPWKLVGGEIARLRFSTDRRMQDVYNMFQTARPHELEHFQDPVDGDAEEVKRMQQAVMVQVADAVYGTLIGRGMFEFANLKSILGVQMTPPPLNISARLGPNRVTVVLEPETLSVEAMEWQEFHNGVATALVISAQCEQLDSPWILYHRPDEFDANHAGFLLALGLTGQLRKLVSFYAIDYLTEKHDLTSIGLLLGLAAAYQGTCDDGVLKLLCMHIPGMLPPESNELNISATIQIACAFGVGLLHQGSSDRRKAEIFLGEIGRRQIFDGTTAGRDGGMVASNNGYREAFSLASGFSLGLIMLSKGSLDAGMVETLTRYIHGDPHKQKVKRKKQDALDLTSAAYMDYGESPTDITAPSASVALALMFLQSNNPVVGEKLAPPETLYWLEQVRPDVLQIRQICRNLVLWNSVKPTIEWVEQCIPEYIRAPVEMAALQRGHGVTFVSDDLRADVSMDESVDGRRFSHLLKESHNDTIASLQHAYYHLIAAGCFSIGLRFAGSGNPTALATLIHHLDLWMAWLKAGNNSSFSDRLTRSMLKTTLDNIVVACAMVAAGSGNIDVLKRLRMLHGGRLSKELNYGNHTSVHMALGMLFLGGGTQTLTTHPLAVACLLASMYPKFPVDAADNRCHLQAFRHMWVLATEERCLQTREVHNQQLVPVSIRLVLNDETWPKDKSGKAILELVTPCVIPEWKFISSVSIASPRYWPVTMERQGTWTQSNVLLIKRRVGHLNYLDDSRGLRSIFSQSLPQSLFTGQDADEGDMKALDDFLQHFSSDPVISTFAQLFCRRGEMVTHGVKWIWECLTEEKVEALPIMVWAYELVNQKHPISKQALDLIRATVEFQKPSTLLSLQFIDLLSVKLSNSSIY
jgi:anaphase-promoting complex subunit 1